MPRYAYEWLSGQDLSFLLAERENAPMHVAAVAILEASGLRSPQGGVDIGRFLDSMQSILHRIPRYRQKLAWSPLAGRPVWVDDRHFQLRYHVRHASLPRPGTLAQLKELAAWILSRPLDRARPLWEAWLVEGVEGGEQFALITKIHHCMIDGAAGADLAQIMLSPSPRAAPEEPLPYIPRPAPGPGELARAELARGAASAAGAVAAVGRALREPGAAAEDLRRRGAALAELLRFAIAPASATPLNGEAGPHRRVDWLTMPLEDALELRKAFGCSLNDVVLATVAGAVRRYLLRRRTDPARIDFRVSAPVNVRRAEHRGQLGNHVSSWVLRLPVGEADALARLAAIREETVRLKREGSAIGVETLMAIADWLPPRAIASAVPLAAAPANMIVTNVHGPPFPLYLVGSKLLGMYPVVPLLPRSGLGIALFSYDGRLCWGFSADYDLVPDLGAVVAAVQGAFEELRAAAVKEIFRKPAAPAAPAAAAPADGAPAAESPEAGIAGAPTPVLAAPAAAQSDAARAPAAPQPAPPTRLRPRSRREGRTAR